ncbi:VWA domain-containing protein [soil metagenome]
MKKIILLFIPVFLIMLSFNSTKQKKVTGIVTDEKGMPVSAVTVSSKYKGLLTTTDEHGSYTITLEEGKATLIFSHVGYDKTEVKVNNRSVVNIMLKKLKPVESMVLADSTTSGSIQFAAISANVYQFAGKVSGAYTIAGGNNGATYFSSAADADYNTEEYDNIAENTFLKTTDNPLSTFSIDVDAASYSNVRRMLNAGQLPPAGGVRVEEMINYFHYDYPTPTGDDPFAFTTEMADCPWNSDHQLIMIGMQGKKIPTENLPPSNMVFLVDVSGSMDEENKLPLVKSSLKLLTEQLREEDKVSIVVYAGAAGLVLPPTSGSNKKMIRDAIDQLNAGGSTAGGEGIMLAYKTANKNYNKEGNNRVILCTDGDFNIGMSSDDDMERLIEKERNTGVFLTVLGYGMGNYKDSKMQKLADKGNGNHAYIDGIDEAKKVLVNEFGGTLFTIAKDVKLQVEFNPAKVQGYRLVGYENRMLKKEDFNDDKKDAGELGSGHTVTALYEVIPAGVKSEFLKDVDKLKYNVEPKSPSVFNKEIMTIKFRYKTPVGAISKLIEKAVYDNPFSFSNTSDNFRFAASVAEFGMLLRNSEYKSASSFPNVLSIARKSLGNDKEGYRNEFIKLVEQANALINNAARK